MKIKETICKLCDLETTTFAFICFEEELPLCKRCIDFIRGMEKDDFDFLGADEK